MVILIGYRHQSPPRQEGYSHRPQERGPISASPCEGTTLAYEIFATRLKFVLLYSCTVSLRAAQIPNFNKVLGISKENWT
jgi:hypothetical protein